MQLRRLAHDARNRFLSEEFKHFLYVELPGVAALNHRVLLGDPLLHHCSEFYDFLFELFDALLSLGGHLLAVAGAGPDIRLEGLNLLRTRFDDLFDRNAEGLQRCHDDLLLDSLVCARGKGMTQLLWSRSPLALLDVEP